MGSLIMEWSARSATKAYLDTLKLCGYDIHKRRRTTQEPGSSEFVSALAAGMRAKLIVEVAPEASPSTIALAAAARHTGGRLVCILPEPDALPKSKRVIRDSGLKDLVEFETGDPTELLARHSNVDFSLVNCTGRGRDADSYARLLGSIDVNRKRSVVVAKNFLPGESKVGLGLGFGRLGHFISRVLDEKKVMVKSVKQYPVGKGMEVITMIEKRDWGGGVDASSIRVSKNITRASSFRGYKSKWVAEFDEESGEEHIFRVPTNK